MDALLRKIRWVEETSAADVSRPRERKVNILVADEQADWVKEFLTDLHSPVVDMYLAEDERQGLGIIRREQMDLAVIAGDNPRVGGLELVKRVRRYSCEVPVIVVGGPPNGRWLQEAFRSGVRTIIPRPVNVHRLVSVSVKILGV